MASRPSEVPGLWGRCLCHSGAFRQSGPADEGQDQLAARLSAVSGLAVALLLKSCRALRAERVEWRLERVVALGSVF
ncbi:hypothetical protein D623_10024182 [Myotis brandtii]|uniref:Uncharacterized protein n=1 Tax=Myotis brandtii TaxID=109478 RepID=S7PY95_MYOBR|nr:hypothetical protein D623_10024182 [Myotis brandtii]